MAAIVSITRASATPTSDDALLFTVTFNAPVQGVDAADFELAATATAAGIISGVSSSDGGTTWQVSVIGVTGTGNLGLNLKAAKTITDLSNVAIDAGGLVGQVYALDNTGPAVTSVAVPANATYHTGENLDFTVTFDQAFTVTGTPRIALTVGTSTVYANYVSSAGNTALFRYTVTSGAVDANGIEVGALSLNGGTIKDGLGNNAFLTLNAVGVTTAVLVDATDPTVASTTSPTAKTYVAGEHLDFTVKFNEVVNVTGTPFLAVTIGTSVVQATYLSGTGTDTVTFRYTVLAGNIDTNGISVASGITLNGGSIRDGQGNHAVGSGISFPGLGSVLVDAAPPAVSSIERIGPEITKAATQQFTVTFSESVTGVDLTDFTLATTGSATGTLSSISGSGSTYTVTVTGVSGDGALGLNLNGAGTAIVDSTSAPIGGGFTGQTFVIDNTAPTTLTIGAVATNDVISAGETTGLKITGTAEAETTVQLSFGGVVRTPTLTAGNWSYEVTDDDLRAMGSGAETLSVTATDKAGNVSAAVTRPISIDIGVVPSGPGTPTTPTPGTPGPKPTSIADVVKLAPAEATKAVLEAASIIPDSSKVTAGTGTAATVYKNVSDAFSAYSAGTITLEQLEVRLVDATLPTTGVAHDAYKFFTGSAPTPAGMTYLIDSPTNTSDLTDAYYGVFTLENRYINFSVNLGKLGEGRAAFEAKYGTMTFSQAVEKAYGDIIGFANAIGAGVDFAKSLSYIESQRSYFEALGGDSLGAKAAMVGYVLSVGSTFHLGNYYADLKDYVLDGVVSSAGSPAASWDLI
ncbi:hypothetical protein [Caulobacter sp. NIBR2454]|uniref:hypothetical protein n=1 Tax=Caulobacter sp. NIBR2454 TaxID=3015996 RepID=UPI0022B5E82A|nr:hypothetical protein [Caulobacter sp. NIBR2454]